MLDQKAADKNVRATIITLARQFSREEMMSQALYTTVDDFIHGLISFERDLISKEWFVGNKSHFCQNKSVRAVKVGLSLLGGGIVSSVVSLFLGAGPCNATTPGLILMLLGLFAVPIGLLTFVGALIFSPDSVFPRPN